MPRPALLALLLASVAVPPAPGQTPSMTPPSNGGIASNTPATVPIGPATSQIIDLFASSEKTGAPELSLTASDLELLDDGKPVPITSFLPPTPPDATTPPAPAGQAPVAAAGQSVATQRPVVLWVIVQCGMRNVSERGTLDDNGSGFLRGYTADLASGLTRLRPGEAYGLAHWCDDGVARLDLPPNRQLARLGPTLTTLMADRIDPPTNPFLGESSLQKVIRDTLAATARFNLNAMPVLMFLYGDHNSMNARQVSELTQELQSVPAMVFLVNSGRASPASPAFREVSAVVTHLAIDTGGSFFHAPFGDHDPLAYAQATATVLARLHSRYQLTWKPRIADAEGHTLVVRLTPAARKAHPGLLLRSRSFYLAAACGTGQHLATTACPAP